MGSSRRNGGHGWIELVEICNLSSIAEGFGKVWGRPPKRGWKVRSGDLIAVVLDRLLAACFLRVKDGSGLPGAMNSMVG